MSRFSSTPSVPRADSTVASSFGKLIWRSRGGRDGQAVVGNPAIEIGQRPRADRLLPGDRLFIAAQPRAVSVSAWRAGERRKQPEIDVHRLKRAAARVDGLDMAAGDVAEQR